VGNLDGYDAACLEIGPAEDGSHAAAGDDALKTVVVELFARSDGKSSASAREAKKIAVSRYQRSR
jgi:hypothetical protein